MAPRWGGGDDDAAPRPRGVATGVAHPQTTRRGVAGAARSNGATRRAEITGDADGAPGGWLGRCAARGREGT